MPEASARPRGRGARSFCDAADRPPEPNKVPVVSNGEAQTLGRGELQEVVDLCSIDTNAEARHHFKAELAGGQQAIQRVDPRVRPAALDPGDRLLRDPGLGGKLALRQ